MIEAIEPGPAIIGIAIGKTEMSSGSRALTSSARFSRRSVRFSNTMSIAIRKSRMPPAIRKARERDAERAQQILAEQGEEEQDAGRRSPTERNAMTRRWRASAPLVTLAKIGAQPGGSITTRKVTKAEMKSSIIAPPAPSRPGPGMRRDQGVAQAARRWSSARPRPGPA